MLFSVTVPNFIVIMTIKPKTKEHFPTAVVLLF